VTFGRARAAAWDVTMGRFDSGIYGSSHEAELVPSIRFDEAHVPRSKAVRVCLEVFGKGERLQKRRLRHRPITVIGDVIDECERRYERSVLRKMPLESRRHLGMPQALLEA
jgi:hypothetical protein